MNFAQYTTNVIVIAMHEEDKLAIKHPKPTLWPTLTVEIETRSIHAFKQTLAVCVVTLTMLANKYNAKTRISSLEKVQIEARETSAGAL